MITVSVTTLSEILTTQCQFCKKVKLNKLPYQSPLPGVFSVIDSIYKEYIKNLINSENRVPWLPEVQITKQITTSWRTFSITYKDMTFRGVPDFLLQDKDDNLYVAEHKTSLLTKTQELMFDKYKIQLSLYSYMAQNLFNKKVVSNHLIFTEPQPNILTFTLQEQFIQLEPIDVIPLLDSIPSLLNEDIEPSQDCDNCQALVKIASLLPEK